jgi:NADH:ubiquinone oxidoreductase subunit
MKLLALAATFMIVMVVDGSKIKNKFATKFAQQDDIPAEWADWLANFSGEFPPPPPALAQKYRMRAQQTDEIPPEWIDWL